MPIKVVVFDSKWAHIEVGHTGPPNDASLSSGYRGDFLMTDFKRSPMRIELEFPRSNVILKVEEVIDDEGEKRLEGYWKQTEKDAAVKKLQITRWHWMAGAHWFDQTTEILEDEPDMDQPKGEVDGRWSVEFEGSGEKALLDIYQWVSMKGEIRTTIDAEFLSYRTTNRFFAGRVDGNLVRLASFDNGVPVLVHAELQSDGTLKGDLWIGDWEHHSWAATRETNKNDP